MLELTQADAAQLYADIREYGPRAVGISRQRTRDLVQPPSRADLLHAWLRDHGTEDPRRFVTVPQVRRDARRPGRGRLHMVIGDCHAAPGQDLARFAKLGQRIAEFEPDVVVQIGDWYSFDSLCYHASAVERSDGRVIEDLAAGDLALETLHANLVQHGRPGYAPEFHITLGNHDVRLAKLADEEPWFEGFHTPGYAHEARGWRVHPYRQPVRIDGVRYQHDLPANGSNRAIGGKYHAARLLDRVRYQESVVVGHSHRLDYRTEGSHTGKRVHAIVVGCYLDHVEAYASEDNREWWSGVVLLHDVIDGDIVGGVQFIPHHPEAP